MQVQPICRLLRPEIAGVDIYPRSEVVVQTNNSAWKYAGHVTEVMELSKPTALVQAVRSHTGNVAVHSTKVHPAHHQVLRNVLEGGRLPWPIQPPSMELLCNPPLLRCLLKAE
jgi:hypothetical protein